MSDETNKPRWGIAPFFVVADVVATANYYRDQLGFHYERFCAPKQTVHDSTKRRSTILR